MKTQRCEVESLSDDEFKELVSRPECTTNRDLWFPERLEAKGAMRDLEMLQRLTELKSKENMELKEVSNDAIKRNTQRAD
ncbi:hypothetical protein BA953_17180 [Vibrio coralliilyticus]|nr:hypothetical protein BA953_17180 [Vibrio coralliilyticus]